MDGLGLMIIVLCACITDYVGFIKKVMKQLQNARYVLIQRTDVDLRQLDQSELAAAAPGPPHSVLYFIHFFIYYTVYKHVMSFTVTVNNCSCGKVTCHCKMPRPYRARLSLFLNVSVVTVMSEMTV